MNKMRFYLLSIIMMAIACIRLGPCRSAATGGGPYIDSTGLRASLARIDNIVDQSTGALIKQALEVPGNARDNSEQPDFFQSLEDDYQKYQKLFKMKKGVKTLEVTCNYDLLETFRVKIFDPQPFLNAILHTMTLREITTLDYAIQSDKSDTLILQVSWAKPTAQQTGKGFGITEGVLSLFVTKHSVLCAEPLPEALEKNSRN
jgi:hypothetical protein